MLWHTKPEPEPEELQKLVFEELKLVKAFLR